MKTRSTIGYLAIFIFVYFIVHINGESRSPRIVTTKYGKLRGIIRPLINKNLHSVEIFLGVPYATPPIGTNRFSPTKSPNSWEGEREASQYGSVCPQRFPDDEETKKIPESYALFINKMKKYLVNQNEDCLYLNIYVPSLVADTVGHKALPVVVLIHGGSFEWGASNPYDGSVFAAYGEVIVVTINYRLGPLGFLNTNSDSSSRGHVMNHGLMDQIAALHWIQECIGTFGGDPGSVTLLGHGTGAACIQFLMVSRAVMPGLFHRAVLISGSALSSWASVATPRYYALKLGFALNCTGLVNWTESSMGEVIPTSEEMDSMVNCLKSKPIMELNSVKITSPEFLNSFGPSIDGIVIKADYKTEIHKLAEESTREYDLLFGVVPQESYNDFSQDDLRNGISQVSRDKIFRTLIRNTFDYHLNEVFISVVNEYTDWSLSEEAPLNVRNALLEALSDSRYVAPLVRTSKNFRVKERNQFFYVFNHTSIADDHHILAEAVHGSELAYILGVPLVMELGIYSSNWSIEDQSISEAMLTYFSNFVKTGNPNMQNQQSFFSNSLLSEEFRGVVWPKYDSIYQKFFLIGNNPRIQNHYRAHKLALWTWLIPQLQKVGKLEFITLYKQEKETMESEEIEQELQELSVLHHLFADHDDPNLYHGLVRPIQLMAGHYIIPSTTAVILNMSSGNSGKMNGISKNDHPVISPNTTVLAEATMPEHTEKYMSYSTALSVTIAIGTSILILNLLIIAGVYYQKDKRRNYNKKIQSTLPTSQSSGEDQLTTFTGMNGPLIKTSLKDIKKQRFIISPTKVPPPSPLNYIHEFHHISECPPAFADKPPQINISGKDNISFQRPKIPNGSAVHESGGSNFLRPPLPRRLFSSESQPLLAVTVPSSSKVSPLYNDLRV